MLKGLSCFSGTSPSLATTQTRRGELLCPPEPRIQAGFVEEPAAPPAPAAQASGQAGPDCASPSSTLPVH